MGSDKSMLAIFHDQKNGDFNDETMTIKQKSNFEMEQEKIIENSKELEEIKDCIKNTVDMIKKIELADDYGNNEEQIELLKKTKKDAFDKIIDVLRDVKEYMMTIRSLDEVKMDRDSEYQDSYAKRLESADEVRKRKHNALISDLQSTIRFISMNFNQISPKAIEKWEEEKEENGFAVLKAKRQKFSKNILCPDNVDIRDRNSIANWASKVFEASLDKIKKRLS